MNQRSPAHTFQLVNVIKAIVLAALFLIISQQPLYADDTTLTQDTEIQETTDTSTDTKQIVVTSTIDSDTACAKDATGVCPLSAGSVITADEAAEGLSPTAVSLRDASLASNSATRMALILLLAAIASLGWMIYQQNKSS